MSLYSKIHGINKDVSRIFLGTGFLPNLEDYDAWLTGILDTGVNAIDTARIYPDSEKTIGKWLDKTGVRDKVVLLSKCGHPDGAIKRVNQEAMMSDLQARGMVSGQWETYVSVASTLEDIKQMIED